MTFILYLDSLLLLYNVMSQMEIGASYIIAEISNYNSVTAILLPCEFRSKCWRDRKSIG